MITRYFKSNLFEKYKRKIKYFLIAHNALGLTWVVIFSTKDGGAANQIRNGDWMQDQTLKDDLKRKVRQNWKKGRFQKRSTQCMNGESEL